MLADLTTYDIALATNIFADPEQKDQQTFMFADSFERYGQGLYHVSLTFSLLGKNLIKSEYPFEQLERDYYDQLHKDQVNAGNSAIFDNAEANDRREAYMLASMQQKADFPESYGVCDYPSQVVEQFPKLISDPRRFILTFQEVRKSEQPERDGWRWHKWGTYIGSQNSSSEYIADEPDIELVYIFHVLELNPLPTDED
jgi:hypothetical protein